MAADLKAELDAVEGLVPRYLYRTHSSRSNGRNSSRSFTPESRSYTDKLSDIEHQHAKDMLEGHFLWRGSSSDQFISWTSSLLWALQHAIRKGFQGDTDVQICVLDTSKIETCSFFAASDLVRIYRIPNEFKLEHRYYAEEYLYHGGLFVHGSSSTVSLDLLREHGLFSLLPEMDDPTLKPRLCKTVEHLRATMVSVPRPVDPVEGRTALQIASLFGKEFNMPVMVALLALRRRVADDFQCLRLVADYAEPSRDFTGIIPPSRSPGTEAPELANFAQLMSGTYAVMQRTKSVMQSTKLNGPNENEELGSALDALSACFDEFDTTIKGIHATLLSPSVMLQWSTATQALRKVVYVNWARERRNQPLQSENLKPEPFPVRLASGSNVGISGPTRRINTPRTPDSKDRKFANVFGMDQPRPTPGDPKHRKVANGFGNGFGMDQPSPTPGDPKQRKFASGFGNGLSMDQPSITPGKPAIASHGASVVWLD